MLLSAEFAKKFAPDFLSSYVRFADILLSKSYVKVKNPASIPKETDDEINLQITYEFKKKILQAPKMRRVFFPDMLTIHFFLSSFEVLD